MSIYYCQQCDRYCDDDWNPMSENETCDECLMEKEEPVKSPHIEAMKKTVDYWMPKLESQLGRMKEDPYFNQELRR